MTVAVLNDIHGNERALAAVLAEPDVATARTILVGGDAVPGPNAARVLELLREAGPRVTMLRGNGEREVAAAQLTTDPDEDSLDGWVKRRLDIRDLARFSQLALLVELDGVRYCHATPTSDAAFFTTLTPDEDVLEAVAPVRSGTLVVGHTHSQFDRTIGDLRIVNPGSVGLPYDGSPGARWALVHGPDVSLRVTAYDHEAEADAWESSGFPAAEQWAGWLRTPPTALEVAEHFESLRRAAAQ